MKDCVGAIAEEVCAFPKPGRIILLENLRFHPEEQGFAIDDEGIKVTNYNYQFECD